MTLLDTPASAAGTDPAPAFDVVVVGAGPAGAAAALVLARAGRSVCLLERGPFPGSKNLYGGVVYGRILDELVPDWTSRAPIQRWITRRQTLVLSDDGRSLGLDVRNPDWGRPPYNGATALRPEFDAWLAGEAEAAGATLVCSTVATGLLRSASGAVRGVRTDRPDGDLTASVVVAADGVNSFLAKEAGLYPHAGPEHTTLGVKEVLSLPRGEIDARFGVRGQDGVDIEVLGGTAGVAGGGFVYTNLDTISVGVVLSLTGLASSGRRPEEILAGFKAHPAIAPLVEGGELVEYGAHLIPEGGYDAMPGLIADGLLVAGDAAGLCLAAGIWLEGVNFAIGSGAAAGEEALSALIRGDTSAAGLAGYRQRLESSFVLADHRKLRRAPGLILSDRMQRQYPALLTSLLVRLFTVENPRPKRGVLSLARESLRAPDAPRLRDLARDAWTALRTYG